MCVKMLVHSRWPSSQ